MKNRIKYGFFGFFVAVFIFLLSQTLFYPFFLRIQNIIDGSFFFLKSVAHIENTSDKIIIVDYDKNSINSLGSCKSIFWKKSQMADVIGVLHRDGAKLIFLDMILAEGKDRKGNIGLADSVFCAGNVLAGYFFKYDSESLRKKPLDNIFSDNLTNRMMSFNTDRLELLTGKDVVFSYTGYVISSMGSGFTNYAPGPDNVVRHVPLFMKFGNIILPSASMQMWLYMEKRHFTDCILGNNHVKIGNNKIPTDNNCFLRINYKSPSGFYRKISFLDVLNNNFNKGFFKDKIVMIGSSSKELGDVKKIPGNSKAPGVEIHASALSTLMDRDFVKVVPGDIILILTLITGVVSSIILRDMHHWKRNIQIIAAVASVLYFIAFLIFAVFSVTTNISIPILSMAIISFIMRLYRYFEIMEEKSLS